MLEYRKYGWNKKSNISVRINSAPFFMRFNVKRFVAKSSKTIPRPKIPAEKGSFKKWTISALESQNRHTNPT